MAEPCNIFYRLAVVSCHNFLSRLIALNVKAAMHDAHQGNELSSVILDEKYIFVPSLELGRTACRHGHAVHRSTKHANRVSLPRRSLESVFHFEGDVTDNVSLGTFAHPLRANVCHSTLKNSLGLIDQLIKSGWNNSSGLHRAQRGHQTGEKWKIACLFHRLGLRIKARDCQMNQMILCRKSHPAWEQAMPG